MTDEVAAIGVKLDTSDVDKGIKALDTLASQGPKVENSMKSVEGAAAKTGKTLATLGQGAGAGLDQVGKKLAPVSDGLDKVGKSAGSADKAIKAVGQGGSTGVNSFAKAVDKASTGVKALGGASAAANRGVLSFSDSVTLVAGALKNEAAALGGISGSIAAVNAAHAAAAKNAQDFAQAIRIATEQSSKLTETSLAAAAALGRIGQSTDQGSAGVRRMAQEQEGLAATFGSIRAAAGAVLGGTVVIAAKAAATAIFEASAAGERLRTMLDFATGGNGAKEIEYLRGVTERLGLQFSTTAVAYGQFQAAAKGTSLEGEKARSVFESVAKASAVMGLSADKTSGVLQALQQMISKGTVQAEELRGQLGERLPGAFQIAAKAMGVTTAELGKMLEQGEVIASDFLPKFGKALEENLGGAAEKAAQRLDAAVNRFDNAWTRLKQTAGDSGISKALGSEVEAITRDLVAVTDAMENARKAGGGMFAELATGGGVAAGRTAFSTLNLAANTLNGTINLLTGGLFGLRTDLALLPDAFKTNEQRAVALATDLQKAEAEFAALQKRGDTMGGNIYYKAEMANLAALIKELKSAQEEKAKLTGAKDPRDQSGFTPRSQSYAAEEERIKGVQAAMGKVLGGLSGVKDGFYKDLNALYAGYQNGLLKLADYQKAVADLIKDSGSKKADRSGAAAINAEQNAYESLIASIRAKIQEDKNELSGNAALTESQRMRIKLDEDLAAGKLKLGESREREVRAAIEEKSVTEAAILTRRTLEKANLEAAQSREKYITSLAAGVDKINADITAQKEATARLGLTKIAVADLDAAKLEMLATDLELQAIKQMDRNLDEQAYEALKDQAKAYRELAQAKREGAAKESMLEAQAASSEAAKKAAEDWQRTSDEINRSLTDALLRGFESGRGFAENFRNVLKSMFSTLVLRPVISFIVNPIGAAIGGIVNSGLSALGLGGNLLGGGGSSILGALGSVGSSVAGWIGSGVGSIFGGAAGNAAIAASLGLGTGSATAAATGAAIAGGGTGAGAGLGAFLGANAIPILGGAVAAITMLARATRGETRVGGQFGVAFGGEVDNNRRGQTYTYQGQQYDRDFSGGRRDALVDGEAYRLEGDPVKDEALIRQAVADTAKGINDTLKALGSVATVTGFSAGLETSGKGRGGVFAGGTLSNGVAFGESGQGDNYAGTLYELTSTNSPDYQTALANFTLDLKQSTIQALQAATDIPESVKEMLEGVDAESLSDEAANALLTAINTQIAGVTAFRDALGNMGLEDLAGVAYDVAVAVAEASGGFEALGSNMTSFWENYFTPEERESAMRDRVTEALAEVGIAMPATRAEFRALVLQLLAMGEEGAEAAAVLLSVNDEFAALTEGAASAAEAMGITAGGLAGIMSDAVRNSSSRGEAEEKASRGFEEMFYDGILNTMTSALSEGLMSAVLGPLLNGLVGGAIASGTALAVGGAAGGGAVAAGGAMGGGAVATGGAQAGGAVAAGGMQAGAAMAAGGEAAGGRVTDFITSAREYINQFMAVLKDPGVQGAIGEFAGIFGNITGDLYEGMNTFFINSKSMPAVGGSLSSAMGDVKNSMQDLTDSLVEEVKRIRGLIEESASPVYSFSQAEAQFAIATAAARAGDKEAAEKLPELSQKLLELAEENARTTQELRLIQATTAASLQATAEALVKKYGGKLPSFAVGTNEIPFDMVAQVHQGERIIPAADNRALMAALQTTEAPAADQAPTRELMRAMDSRFEKMQDHLSEIDGNTRRLSGTIEDWSRNGAPVKNQDGTTLATNP